MSILSATPCSRFIISIPPPRVSPPPPSSSSISFSSSSSSSPPPTTTLRRRRRRQNSHPCPCTTLSSSSSSSSSSLTDLVVDDIQSSGQRDTYRLRNVLAASSGEELLHVIRKEAEAGRLPSNVASGMEALYDNYSNAVFQSGIPSADEVILSNMSIVFDRIFSDVEDPFVFSPHHKAIREPFDYYTFGQNYIRPLVDFRNSYVGNISIFYEMEQRLQQGHNVVLISNHQTEADPAVIALSLEKTNAHIAENLAYIAGDRVLTDPLCKPFSMGRNLICVYSKKHMHDVPELADIKRRANTRSLKEMALLLRGGSQIIWIAPSGGRDRPHPSTDEWYPAPFDASSVDNIRRLAEHSGVPGHIYPLALLCHDIMPPPAQVEKEIGEKRMISFHGTGLSVGPEINYLEVTSTSENSEKAKIAYTQALYNSVVEQYNVLNSAIHAEQGLEASTSSVSLSQPWK